MDEQETKTIGFSHDNTTVSYTVLGSQVDLVAALQVSDNDIVIRQNEPTKTADLPHDKTKPTQKIPDSDEISSFDSQLSKLEAKAKTLKADGYEDAYKNAMKIHSTLIQAYKTLLKDKNLQDFNKTCTDIIAEKRPILDKHRGWSEFLINLAIAIPTLGFGLLIKGAINLAQNKSFFFVHKTESGKIVDEIQDKLGVSSFP